MIAAAAVLLAQFAFPPDFQSKTITTPQGADIFVRVGGSGPAVLLLHGFGDTGDMWAPLAATLAKDHTLIVPDLRGMGRSSHPAGGYDKKSQAVEIRSVVTALGFDRTAVVGHDIGNMVAYAYVAQYPDKVERLIVMDAPLPGIDPWDQIKCSPNTWHFNFRGPDVERLVAGRERILLDRFYDELSAHPERIVEATRQHYAALYAQPGAMHSSFEQFKAFAQDSEDNKVMAKTPLTMPVLAVGAEKSFGPTMAVAMRHVATNVTEAVVPDSGHWIMEENPQFAIGLIRDFLSRKDAKYSAMLDDAMARMDRGMQFPYSGDADRDFARMMIPHHQGAIDMALAELRYGKDERLKRLAQEIIVTQQQEIAVMQLALRNGQ
jgi:pimeloyl-ACP methyl ester carboxylesterase